MSYVFLDGTYKETISIIAEAPSLLECAPKPHEQVRIYRLNNCNEDNKIQ